MGCIASQLRRIYAPTPIETVDILGSATEIDKLVSARAELGQFDYIISSHNFEHLPDPIRFLRGCEKVLKQGEGMISMAIPDRRACFDYCRPYSTLSDVLSAYLEQRTQPSWTQCFEYYSYRTNYKYVDSIIDSGNVSPATDLTETFRDWTVRNDSDNSIVKKVDGYHDVHCWVFTPTSLELILRDLRQLGLISLDIVEISQRKGIEFFVHLRNSNKPPQTENYERIRHSLMLRMVEEATRGPVLANEMAQKVLRAPRTLKKLGVRLLFKNRN